MKHFSNEVVEQVETLILRSITFLKNCAVYEIMWKNIVQRGMPRITIWRMRIASWIPKATNTLSEYVIDFPLQQWLQECASVLRYLYIASLIGNIFLVSIEMCLKYGKR
jgi:hypothetical protein